MYVKTEAAGKAAHTKIDHSKKNMGKPKDLGLTKTEQFETADS